MTAERWSVPMLGHALFLGPVVLGHAGDARAALDLETGAERFRVETPGEGTRYLAPCGHLVRVGSREAAGIDVNTGAVTWQRTLVRDGVRIPPGHGAVLEVGCHVVYQLDDFSAAPDDPFRPRELWALDAATGAPERVGACPADANVAVIDGALLVGGARIELPLSVRREGPWIDRGEGILVGRSDEGAELWRRAIASGVDPPWAMVLARPDGDAVVLDGDVLVRVSRSTGADVWRLPLSGELAAAVRSVHGHAWNERHVVIGSRQTPRILLDVDPATGAVRSLRISSVDPVELHIAGDLVLVQGHGGTGAVVDLRLDASPIRSRLTLEDDLARTLAVLETSGPEGRGGVDVCPWAYPADGRDAIAWLRRLAPMSGDVVSATIADAPLGRAANLLSALSGAAATTAAIAVLRRTYGPLDATAAAARARACDALASPIADDDGDALLRATVDALDAARASGETNYRGWTDAWRPVVACRDALGRSAAAAVLVRWDEAIAARAPSLVTDDCEPSEDDAARAAVLRFWFELQDDRDLTVTAPGASCIQVQTLDGPLSVSRSAEPARPFFVVGRPYEIEERDRSQLPWPDAPARQISIHLSAGHSEGDTYVVQRVEGRWRVVSEALDFTS